MLSPNPPGWLCQSVAQVAVYLVSLSGDNKMSTASNSLEKNLRSTNFNAGARGSGDRRKRLVKLSKNSRKFLVLILYFAPHCFRGHLGHHEQLQGSPDTTRRNGREGATGLCSVKLGGSLGQESGRRVWKRKSLSCEVGLVPDVS